MKLDAIPHVCPVPISLELPELAYKYRNINKFLFRSLLLNQVWLAQPCTFNDPFEPERIFSGSAFSQALERSVRASGVLCLCKSATNLPMWSYYGNGLRGLAVAYDMAELLKSLVPVAPTANECSTRWKYVFALAYQADGLGEVDEMALLRNDALTDAERQKMFATKSPAYEHEEEIRIVVQPSPDSTADFAWQGHGLYQHTPGALREIIFGELVSAEDQRAITEVLVGRDVVFRQAKRNKSSFSIHIADMAG